MKISKNSECEECKVSGTADGGLEKSAASAYTAAVYTCPMHPEVRQAEPGNCPICGMALEPVVPVAAAVKTEWVCPMHPQIVRDAPRKLPDMRNGARTEDRFFGRRKKSRTCKYDEAFLDQRGSDHSASL